MKLKTWMIVKAVIVLVFGLGFVLAPEALLSIYGMSAGEVGILMSRLFGQGFLLLGLLLWFARDASEASVQRAFALAAFVGDMIGFVILLLARLSGVGNSLGWINVALYLIIALGFGYFLLPGSSRT